MEISDLVLIYGNYEGCNISEKTSFSTEYLFLMSMLYFGSSCFVVERMQPA